MYRSYVFCSVCILEICADDSAVVSVRRVPAAVPCTENTLSMQAAGEIRAYLEGTHREFSFPCRPAGTQFQQTVWQALLSIPYGSTLCYGEIAERIGKPKARRAVGQAIGKNPCLIAIPCHRVIGKDGSLTGFGAGLDLKEFLLALEGVLPSSTE